MNQDKWDVINQARTTRAKRKIRVPVLFPGCFMYRGGPLHKLNHRDESLGYDGERNLLKFIIKEEAREQRDRGGIDSVYGY
jgi:hypothetical protein